MPATAHWDDTPNRQVDVGPIVGHWHLLGAAAGCDRIGLRRIEVAPGRQSTPVHAHYGEEELFYVLSGSGWSWQEDGVYAIAAGDVILHPPGGPAHTIVAGDDGIDVLAFGEDLRHEAVRFPRIDATWLGGMILDHRRTHQFELEAEKAGPVELPDTFNPRPLTIIALDDVEPVAFKRGGTDATARFLGRALGAQYTALNHSVLAPGGSGAQPHCHSGVEELFVVLDGDGVLLLGNDEEREEHPLRTGSLVCRPAGTGVAHEFRAGADGLTLLMYSDVNSDDMCFYPRSGKVMLRGLGIVIKPELVPYFDD